MCTTAILPDLAMGAGLNYRGVSAMIMSDLFSRSTLPDVVVHTGNSNTWEAEKGGAPVGEQLVYIMTSYLKKQGQRRNP